MGRAVDLISHDLGVPVELVESALRLAYIRFRKIRVPKKSGGYRVIVQPAAELKLVQAWLISRVYSQIPLSSVASAFYAGASTVKNATRHQNAKYLVRVDVREFFPSLRSADLQLALFANRDRLPEWVQEDEFLNLIRMACFDVGDRLPVGYPSSPAIANIIMRDIDDELLSGIKSNPGRFGSGVLTRYADDFVFSTDKAGACHYFVDEVNRVFKKTKNPCLTVNNEKTRYMSRPGGSALVTGLRINQAGQVRVHPDYRDHVRLLLKLFAKGVLRPDDKAKLIGHLAYIEHADPQLFTRLSFVYFEEIARLRGKAERSHP